MARIYLSPLIVDIRNKQSDTVFSKWKGINYIRSRVVPHNPKSVAQTAIREALARLVALWQSAYPGVKLNWDEWASGRDYSGFNKFIGKNVVKERDSLLFDLTQEVGYTKFLTFSAATGTGSGEIDVTFTPTPTVAGTDLEIYVREVLTGLWEKKEIVGAPAASPITITGLTPATAFEVYGYHIKDATPTGEDVGKDLSDTATSQT